MSTIRSYIISKCARRSTRTRPRNTSYSNALADMAKRRIGSISPTTLRMFEFQLRRISLHLHRQHGQKAQRGGALHLWTTKGKNGSLKDGETKNGGISNNFRQRQSHAQTSTRRVRRSQLLSKSLESGFHLWSCALFRFLVLSGSFVSRQQQLPWTRREVYR